MLRSADCAVDDVVYDADAEDDDGGGADDDDDDGDDEEHSGGLEHLDVSLIS